MNHRRSHRALRALLCLALVLNLAGGALARTGTQPIQANYTDIKVALDGAYLVLTDANGTAVEPFAVAGTTYLPLRAVAGALGLEVAWLADTSTVALTTGGTTATQTTQSPAAGTTATRTLMVDYADIKVTLDGSALALADANGETVEPFAVAGTTYLPLRAIAGALGLEVSWNADSNTVILSTQPFAADPEEAAALVAGDLDKLYLGKYDADYLRLAGITQEEAQASYAGSMDAAARYFAAYWGIVNEDRSLGYDDLPEALRDALVALCEEMFSHVKYEIAPAQVQEDGSCVVTLQVSPVDVIKRADSAYKANSFAPLKSFLNSYTDARVKAMTDAAYKTFSVAYGEQIIALVRAQLEKPGYLADETIVIHMERDADGSYRANQEDWIALNTALINYPS